MFKISVVAFGEVRLHSDLRLIVVGALPLLTTYCPYRARYFLNPGHWGGTQGVAVLRPALPWAEIPLPLQGATGSKPPIFVGVDVSRRHGFKTSVALHCGHISRYASECRTSSYGTITQFKCKNNYEHLLKQKLSCKRQRGEVTSRCLYFAQKK